MGRTAEGAGRARPTRPTRRPAGAARRTMACAVALSLVVAGGRGARVAGAGVGPREADATALAAAFAAAWAARDLEAVVALFADDAVVRQRGAELAVAGDPLYGPSVTVRDAFGVGLDYFGDPPRHDPDDPRVVIWAAGRPQIRAWARRLFASDQTAAADPAAAETAGDTVRWAYRATAAAYRRLPGVAPTAGTIELTVRAGRIVSLTTESDPATVRARDAAIARALRGSAAPPDGRAPEGRAPTGDAWGLPTGLALIGVLTWVLRKRLGGSHRRS